MRILAVIVAFLATAPAATADSIAYATDTVAVPTHVVRLGIDGRGAQTIGTSPVADYRAGHTVAADGKTLLYDGRPIATADWPIDDAQISPDLRQVAFTSVSEIHCGPAATNCATWELWLVNTDGTGLRELSPDGKNPAFSPNGKLLAFLGGFAPLNEGGTTVVQNLATGKRTWFTYGNDARPSWSPDSNHLAYSGQARLRIATVSPRRVTTLAGRGYGPRYSPDGKLLAFTLRTGALAVRAARGGETRVVAPQTTGAWAWATAGWLVYTPALVKSPVAVFGLARVRADGSHRAVLRRYAPTTYFDAVWWTGKSLVFQITRVRFDNAAIEAVDLQTGAIRTLFDDGEGDNLSPTFSPKGGLAFAHGSTTRFGWYCLEVHLRCIVDAQTVDGIRDPEWSPDGSQLAFLRYTKQGPQLAVVDADGSNLRVLRTFTGSVQSPSWSPDGTTIVVGASDYQDTGDIHIHLWTVDVTTGAAVQLDTGDWGGAPSWSPDGTTVAFVGGTWGGPSAIELYDVATHAVTPLVPLGAQPVATRAAWSPDSKQLAYQAEDDTIHVIGRDGTGDRRVSAPAAGGSALAWLPS